MDESSSWFVCATQLLFLTLTDHHTPAPRRRWAYIEKLTSYFSWPANTRSHLMIPHYISLIFASDQLSSTKQGLKFTAMSLFWLCPLHCQLYTANSKKYLVVLVLFQCSSSTVPNELQCHAWLSHDALQHATALQKILSITNYDSATSILLQCS